MVSHDGIRQAINTEVAASHSIKPLPQSQCLPPSSLFTESRLETVGWGATPRHPTSVFVLLRYFDRWVAFPKVINSFARDAATPVNHYELECWAAGQAVQANVSDWCVRQEQTGQAG